MGCLLDFLLALGAKVLQYFAPTIIEIIKVDAAIIENKISELLKENEQKITHVDQQAIIKSAQTLLGDGAKLSEADLKNFIDSHVNAAIKLIGAHESNSSVPFAAYDAHYTANHAADMINHEITLVTGALESTNENSIA